MSGMSITMIFKIYIINNKRDHSKYFSCHEDNNTIGITTDQTVIEKNIL